MTISPTDLHDLHLAVLAQEQERMTPEDFRHNLSTPELLGQIRMVLTPSFLPQLERERPGSIAELQTILKNWRITQSSMTTDWRRPGHLSRPLLYPTKNQPQEGWLFS